MQHLAMPFLTELALKHSQLSLKIKALCLMLFFYFNERFELMPFFKRNNL